MANYVAGDQVSVSLGVKLNILQSSVAEIQKILDKLEPNSTSFKKLSGVIANITKDVDRLQVQMAKPFGSQTQFNQTEKTLDKIEDDLNNTRLLVDRINFSDLKLDSDQLAVFDGFKQKLNSISKEVEVFKEGLKGQFLGDDINRQFVENINPNLINKSFDDIIKAVEGKIKQLTNATQTAQRELENLNQQAALGQKYQQFEEGGFLTEQGLGDKFQEYFKFLKNGALSFKTGGNLKKGEIQQQFLEYIQQEFSLSESQINELRNKTATQIQQILSATNKAGENIFFAPQIRAARSASNKIPQQNVEAQQARAEYEQVLPLIQLLANYYEQLADKEAEVADKTRELTAEKRNAEQANVAEVRGNQQFADSLKVAEQEAENFSTELGRANATLLSLQRQQQAFNSIKMGITNFMGFNQVLNITKRAVSDAINHIKELDTTMNGIAIVTDMTTADLWKQVDAYSAMAQNFGVTIQGAYEVSKIYYQAGYEANDVLTLTNETLKLSKISGLDYATTTDYMMTAMRGFKLEMEDASRVVDVYSNLAANTAVSQQELAEAMTRTASSMESVGATFEETSAMIATMVAVTRESANNIGSAMKSIASRYGELTKDPAALLDAEGEAMSFNKVDEALRSVGITLQTTDHQFRDFTDVIMELAEKWETLDSAQQRYIATQFAGNRQQSRFLALVSNADLLKENLANALNSEDIGTLQALKALDSLESKVNQVQVAYQQFYTTVGIEDVWKALLDSTKNVIDTLNSLPKVFGKIPAGAIAAIANLVSLIKTFLFSGLRLISTEWEKINQNTIQISKDGGTKTGQTWVNNVKDAIQAGAPEIQRAMQSAMGQPVEAQSKNSINFNNITGTNEQQADEFLNRLVQMEKQGTKFSDEQLDKLLTIGDKILRNEIDIKEAGKQADAVIDNVSQTAVETQSRASRMFSVLSDGNSKWSQGLKMVSQALTTVGMLISKDTRAGEILSGTITGIGGTLQAVSAGARLLAGDFSAIPQLLSGILNIFNGIGIVWETDAERLEKLTKQAEELSNISKQEKANYNNLERSINKLQELQDKRYESAEAAEEYQEAVNELADSFPELIAGFDSANNVIVDTIRAEESLERARRKSAQAALNAAEASFKESQELYRQSQAALQLFNPEAYLPTDKNIKESFEKEVIDYIDKNLGYNFIELSNPIRLGETLSQGITRSKEIALEWMQDADTATKDKLQQYIDTLDSLQKEYFISINNFTEEQQEIISQVNLAIDKFSSSEQDSDAANELLNEVYDAIGSDEELRIYFSDLLTYFETYTKLISEGLDQKANLDAAAKVMATQWQANQLIMGKQYDYLKDNSGFSEILSSRFSAEVNTFEDYERLQSEWTEQMEQVEKFWDTLSKKDRELFNKMFADTEHYTAEDILNMSQFATMDDELQEELRDHYQKRIDNIRERLNKQLEQITKDNQNTQFTENYSKFISTANTEMQANYLAAILQQYDNLRTRGYTELAEKAGDAALSLYDQIESLEPALRNTILDIIKQYGLTSIEGIEKIKQFIASDSQFSGLDTSFLDIISSTIIPNVQLGIQAATSSLLESWSGTSKELSKALSSGLELNEADALIQKARTLGLDLDINKDFMLAGDKLILTSNAFDEYLDHLNASSNKVYQDYQNRILRAKKIFNEARTTPDYQLLEPDIAILDSLGFDITTYIDKSGHFINEWQTALLDTINLSNKGLDNLTTYLDLAKTSLLQTTQWSKGNYESIGGDAAIVANASRQAQLLIDRETGTNLLSAVEYFNKAYSSFLQDAISKGFENINPKDYQGILDEDIDWNGSYVNLVKRYADYAGLTLSETNDLIAQAMEKDSETTIGAAQDALKDVTFIFDDLAYASKDTILKIANLFGKSFTDLFDEDSYDAALGGYKLKLEEVPELQAITNAQNMVADSIASYFERIATLISQGLSGKLDNSGRDELVSLLDKYNIDLDLKFTQTAEGLKLSADSAASLYSELYKVDSIRASLVFDELVKQFTAAGEKCETIFGTLAEIKRLENELAKEENKGNKELEDRLALYQRIAAQQSQDPNQFKFMDRNLPNGMQSPENYWNAVGKAYTAINDASTTGYMSVQDYYNIIMEMSNLVTMSNGELEWMGMTSENASQRAAELIKLGMSALANVDGKGVQVALSKLGGDFVNGAAAMKSGLDDGLKVMAQEQINMLDAQIAFLEAIVAFESLDTITGENGIFDLEEVFDPTGLKFADGYIKSLQSIKTELEKIAIGDTNLYKILSDYDTAMQVFDNNHDQFLVFLNSLHQLMSSEDWDINNLPEQIQSIIDSIEKGENPTLTIKSEVEAPEAAPGAEELTDVITGKKKDISVGLKIQPKNGATALTEVGDNVSTSIIKNEPIQQNVLIHADFTEDTNQGLKELIEAINGLPRNIDVTSEGAEVPITLTNDITQLVAEGDSYTLKTVDGKEISVSVKTFGLEDSPLTQVVPGSGKTYWIRTKDSNDINVGVDTTGIETSGLILAEGSTGKIYTINTGEAQAIVVTTDVDVSGLTGNPTDGYTLHTVTGEVINISAAVGEVTGLQPSEDGQSYQLILANGQTITVTGTVDSVEPGWEAGKDGDPNKLVQGLEATSILPAENIVTPNEVVLTTKDNGGFAADIIKWADENTITVKTRYKDITEIPEPTAEDALRVKVLSGEQLSDDDIARISELAESSRAWAEVQELLNQALQTNQTANEDNTTAVDENTKSEENNTTARKNNTTTTTRHALATKAATGLIKKAGEDAKNGSSNFNQISSNTSGVIQAEIALNTSTKQLSTTMVNAITAITRAINSLPQGNGAAKGTRGTGGGHGPIGGNGSDKIHTTVAKGNFADSRGTLMGELGEELYVTNGHYYIAGAAGPEFVDLPDDAIVFNHLQTKRLLQNGKVSTHGKPITNEKKATSFATGNAEGPAMASARSVLEELKNIRAMWQALLEADPKKLGSLAGSGKGGSGGGGGSNKDWDMKSYTAEIQRWYNLLRQIAVLEKEITHQETLRSKLASDLVPNGRAIYESQKKSLAALDKEIINQKSLLILQKEYYADQQKELENSEYNKIFEFKDGTLQYRGSGETGSGLGLDILEQLQRRDVYGKAIDNAETAQKQLDYLVAQGFDIDKLRYNDDGTEVKLTDDKGKALEGEELQNAQIQMLENFFSNVSSFMNEFDSAADNIADLENSILDNESAKNEILRDIRDNQIELEEKIRDAIVEREQQRIDKAKKERDALKESADEFLEGLNNSLNKERQMYQANQSAEDLNKLRRRLAILQRSGGSSSQIRSLQQEIDSKTQDAYFDAQQKQIDAVKEASDLEIERLDRQIEIMEKTLEYQQANGLLWAEVNSILGQDSAVILDFISKYSGKGGLSILANTEQLDDLKSSIGQYQAYLTDENKPNINPTETDLRDDAFNTTDAAASQIGMELGEAARDAFNEAYSQTGDTTVAQQIAVDTHKNVEVPKETPVTPKPEVPQTPIVPEEPKKTETKVPTTNETKVVQNNTSNNKTSSTTVRKGSSGSLVKQLQIGLNNLKYNCGAADGIFGAKTEKAVKKFQKSMGLMEDGIAGPQTLTSLSDRLKRDGYSGISGYSEGGLVNYTGLAVVHGSPTQPESFLDAEDTKFLKANLEAQKVILPDLMDAYRMVNNYNTTNRSAAASTSNAMQIDNIDINLQIASMNSRYDAKQAANDIADELMSIARKSGNISINRR